MSRLSTRISIKWADEPASEPTDTLVMSVGSFYMDLRISQSSGSIDWAMAGERIVVSEEPLTVRFTHEIDSRGYTAPDEGVFTKMPNGDDLETGSMPCPERDGAVTAYEEVWREFPAPKAGSTSWIVRHDDEQGGSTFLGRLDNAYLTFRKTASSTGGGEFTAVREELDRESGKWRIKYQIGGEKLPSMSEIAGADLDGIAGKSNVTILGVEYQVCATAVEERIHNAQQNITFN